MIQSRFRCLSEIGQNEEATISFIDDSVLNKKRLEELGFCKGVVIVPKHFSSNKRLRAFAVLGSIIVLRSEDYDNIYVNTD